MRILPKLVALTFVLGSVVMLTDAYSGTVQIDDPDGLLRNADLRSRVVDEAARWPFDTHVLISSGIDSREDFERVTKRHVDGPNTLSIGIAPRQHLTAVYVGSGVGIPRSAMSDIPSAGNQYFKRGDYAGGIIAIGRLSASYIPAPTANASPQTTPQGTAATPTPAVLPPQTIVVQVPTQQTTQSAQSPQSSGLGMFGWTLFLGLGFLIYYYRRRLKEFWNDVVAFIRDLADYAMDGNDEPLGPFDVSTSSPPTPATTTPPQVNGRPMSSASSVVLHRSTTPSTSQSSVPISTLGYIDPTTAIVSGVVGYELGKAQAQARAQAARDVLQRHEQVTQESGCSAPRDTDGTNDTAAGGSSTDTDDDNMGGSSNWDDDSGSDGSSDWDDDSGSSGGSSDDDDSEGSDGSSGGSSNW